MSYSHLSIDQRNHLYQLKQEQNLSQRELAKLVGCSQSTICRELQRNRTEQGWYSPDKAQVLADNRRKESKKKFNNINDWILHEVKTRLKNIIARNKIAGRLKKLVIIQEEKKKGERGRPGRREGGSRPNRAATRGVRKSRTERFCACKEVVTVSIRATKSLPP